MSEDDEEADLITGVKKISRKIMSKTFCFRIPRLRKIHFLILTGLVILSLIYYLNQTQSDELKEQKKIIKEGSSIKKFSHFGGPAPESREHKREAYSKMFVLVYLAVGLPFLC